MRRVICPWSSWWVAAWGGPMVIESLRILLCLNVIHVMDELEMITSSTHVPTAQTPVMDVENSREEALDNRCEDERRPSVTRQHPRQRRQHHAIRRSQTRPGDLRGHFKPLCPVWPPV